jgi:hypothetical protein
VDCLEWHCGTLSLCLRHGESQQGRASLSIPQASSQALTTRLSIQLATRAAEAFTRLYYKTYDSGSRVQDLASFYRDNSAISWNGNPYQGSQGMRELIQGMPRTKHEIQSYDCHPIPSQSTRFSFNDIRAQSLLFV